MNLRGRTLCSEYFKKLEGCNHLLWQQRSHGSADINHEE